MNWLVGPISRNLMTLYHSNSSLSEFEKVYVPYEYDGRCWENLAPQILGRDLQSVCSIRR